MKRKLEKWFWKWKVEIQALKMTEKKSICNLGGGEAFDEGVDDAEDAKANKVVTPATRENARNV